METTRGYHKRKRRIDREDQLAILEEDLRILREKKEKIQRKLEINSKSGSSKGFESGNTHNEKDSLEIIVFYQPKPVRRPRKSINLGKPELVDLPHFHGKEHVDAYLDWEVKVEELFPCHISMRNKRFL